ncbi:MAG TPA: TIGR04086 family membrane protein [Phototrophicaceae bacterium]|jgi:putative membrane protein (TIGR04086 family)|nr:TIGR04086 family membrane protein [Phototrophicaceae bacterium]
MAQNSPVKPPSRIEPTGFLTGIQFRPILVGVIIDTIATIALTSFYYAFFVAKELSAQGGAEDAYSQYWTSSEGLIASLVLGSLGTLIGGFYAAYKAGSLEMKHGALVGIGSILLGLVLQGAGSDENALPEWFMALSFAAAIPAGALGGFFAEMVKDILGKDRPSPPSTTWPGSR